MPVIEIRYGKPSFKPIKLRTTASVPRNVNEGNWAEILTHSQIFQALIGSTAKSTINISQQAMPDIRKQCQWNRKNNIYRDKST